MGTGSHSNRVCADCVDLSAVETRQNKNRSERTDLVNIIDTRQSDPEHWRPGVETRMVVSAVNGATQLCIFEQSVAPGAGAPTHSHPVEEVLSVREGEAEMWIDEDRAVLTAGQSLIVAALRHHRFRQSRTTPL